MLEDIEVHVTGVLVQALPDHVQAVCAAVANFPEAEVCAVSETGKLVVVCECASADETLALLDRIRDLAGVANVALVYQHTETGAEMDEEIDDEADPPRVH
ncbi:putative NapD protein [Azoarcus olearius]|uniref:chaperone NapD n=1 Tax=Azoarcus sp. (strain BH72) TaxID=418699 RepID=UPI0008062CD2|nr:chaperone NapD [Azoarcus olearius]ANQ83816.1 putative NapD protein [Azoarcus olearius]